MSNKNVAVGTAVILVSTLAVTLAIETYILQSINPIADIAAVTVISIVWLKKRPNPKLPSKKKVRYKSVWHGLFFKRGTVG